MWCWNRIKEVFLTLFQPIELPLIVVGILMLMSCILMLLAVAKLRKENKNPSELDYIYDSFDGMIWKWSYHFSGGINAPWCFCPSCDGVLVYNTDYERYTGNPKTQFQCEHCERTVSTLDGDHDYIVASIRRLIDRKIRTEKYKAVLERQNPKNSTT